MFAPAQKLAACLEVLYRAAIDARLLGWAGEREGLTSDESKRLADLMDGVHNVPGLAASTQLPPPTQSALVVQTRVQN